MTYRVLWPRAFGRNQEVEIEALGDGFTAEFCRGFEEVTEEQWHECDAIVGVSPPTEYLPRIRKCRIMVKTAVGFDDVDLKAWGAAGIPVCNTPDYGTREVADHAIALMMTLTKSIAFHDESLRADPVGNWRPALNPYGRRLSECTFGVIGLGRIGTTAALRAKAFEMDVAFFDPYLPNGIELALGVRKVQTLEELMGQSDIVSVHTPLNDETRNLLDAAAFAAAKPGIIVINTARGPLIDLGALHDAMQKRRGARRGPRRAAGRTRQPERPADRRLAPQRGVAPAPARHHAPLGVLHAREHTGHPGVLGPGPPRDICAGDGWENCVNSEFLVRRR